jgi:nucleotide-binding universal stress UspA family protein
MLFVGRSPVATVTTISEPTVLLSVDVSETPPPVAGLSELLAPLSVVVLGYHPVPDQAVPAQTKRDHGDEAASRLDEVADVDPVERGEAAIAWVAERAGLDPEQYESRVVVDADVEAAILDTAGEYDTVRAGLSEKSDASRILFGSITERISRESTGNVGIVRGAEPVDAAESEAQAALASDGSTDAP